MFTTKPWLPVSNPRRLQVIPSQQRHWLKQWQRLIWNILATMSGCVSLLSQHPAWFMGLVSLPFAASLLRLKGLVGSDVSWSRLFMLTVLLREDQWCISFPFSASLTLLHTCTFPVSQNTNVFFFLPGLSPISPQVSSSGKPEWHLGEEIDGGAVFLVNAALISCNTNMQQITEMALKLELEIHWKRCRIFSRVWFYLTKYSVSVTFVHC